MYLNNPQLATALEMSAHVWGTPDLTRGRTQVGFKVIDNKLWIAFEATDNWDDTLTHIQIWPKKFNGYRVHSGFLKQYKLVHDDIASIIAHFGLPVVFTGHSLGGALAQIATHDYGYTCVTTGCPRLWFYRIPPIEALNYITMHDPVPELPPFYLRAGHDRYLGNTTRSWKDHLPSQYYHNI